MWTGCIYRHVRAPHQKRFNLWFAHNAVGAIRRRAGDPERTRCIFMFTMLRCLYTQTCSMQSSLQMCFTPPAPLLAGRMVFELDASPGLAKTTANFVALCTGEKGMCKNAPNKKLHYVDCPIHRIVKGFVAQGGDVTRGNGSGGEVCRTRTSITRQSTSTSIHSSVHLWRQVQ